MKGSYLVWEVGCVTVVLATFPFAAFWLAEKPIGAYEVTTLTGGCAAVVCILALVCFCWMLAAEFRGRVHS